MTSSTSEGKGKVRCYWCAFELDFSKHDKKAGFTPYIIDLPNVKFAGCNGSCGASWFMRHRPSISKLRYEAYIRDQLHHHSRVSYNCAPEPYDYSWYQGGGEVIDGVRVYADRADYLSRCTYCDSVQNIIVRNDEPEERRFNVLDMTYMTIPEPHPTRAIPSKRKKEEDEPLDDEGPTEMELAARKVEVVAEIHRNAKRTKNSKVSFSKQQKKTEDRLL